MNHKLLRGLSGLTAAVSVCLASGSAFAFAPANQFDGLEIPLNTDHFLYGDDITASAARSDETVVSLERQTGSEWQVFSWNKVTHTPHYVIGNGFDVAPGLTSDMDVRNAAESVAQLYRGALGVNPGELQFTQVRRGLGKSAAHFQQTYQGLEVHGGSFHATFTDAGRLFVMSSDFYSNIELDVNPAMSEDQALAFATGDLNYDPEFGDRVDGDAKLMVLPLVDENDEVEFRLVYQFRIWVNEGTAIWVTSVDANTGEVVWRYNDVHFLDFTGTTEGDVQANSRCETEANQRIAHMDVDVNGAGSATSDSNGDWTIGYGGTGDLPITAEFFGPYCNVNRAGGQGADAVFNDTATAGTPFTIDWNDGNSRQDERDVFDAVSDIHEFFDTFDPGFAYHNARITANVGVAGTCNAYWNGTINFYNTGGGCHNTGEIQGVVHHEFGHGVQNAILGSQGSQGLGEGNSDIISNFITDESVIGRGFQTCNGGIRDCDNTRQYPDDLTGQVHNDGQIICGATWDVSLNLQATLGAEAGEFRAQQLWHFGRVLETPFNQPDQVLSMFIADDDNGDLMDGTPNYDDICPGVEDHGFECPEVIIGVFIAHTPLTTPQPAGDAVIDATVTTTFADGNILPETVLLHYSIEGAPEVEVTMTNTGGDNYTATIPGLELPTCSVDYYLTAADDLENEGSSPSNAPANQHGFSIPSEFDAMEVESGWSVNDEGTDDATTGIWVRVNPNPTDSQPGDDHTPDGSICWITGNTGTGGTDDIDNGTTTLYSPAYDVGGALEASMSVYRWYSNDKGADPNNDIWVIQARNNGGSWVDVERNQSNQNQWFEVSADLVALFGSPGLVEFKFIGSDLNSGSLVEAGVDDFSMCYTGDDPAGIEDEIIRKPAFALYGSRPNPVEIGSMISFQVPASSQVELGLYDVNGRSVRSLATGAFEAGLHSIEWDGKDAGGHDVVSGVYYLKMVAGEFNGSRKLVVR